MSETEETTIADLESPENAVQPELAETQASEMSPAVRAEMAACQQLVDGIASLGFGVDMRVVQSRAEISGLCRALVNSGLIPEETLQREIFASMRQILAATHQDCEVQLARMSPQERAQQLAGAAARRAAMEEAAKQQQQAAAASDPVLQAASVPSKKKPSNLQVVRASDQLVIARR